MDTLKQYWKALGPIVAILLTTINAAGPDEWWGYLAATVLGLLVTVFGPANQPKPEPTPEPLPEPGT